MCSGLTSASSASKAFSKNFFKAVGIDSSHGSVLMITALSFMALIALLNLRGVGESVKANVVLTGVELTGLLIVIAVGAWATAATALAFFAMVGFEDSVNMAEEASGGLRPERVN
jgi:amino acid transporter